MKHLLAISLVLCSFVTFGQTQEYFDIEKGNSLYAQNAFELAREVYLEAIKKNNTSFAANLDLGNTLYRMDSTQSAIDQFKNTATTSPDKQEQASAYHNLGNSYMKQNNYSEAIDAYKESLRRNPGGNETRYNLAYAQKMLKNQQQQQQQNQDQNKDQNKDQKDKGDQNQKEKEKGKDNREKKGDQKDEGKGDSKKDKDKKNQEPQKGRMSKTEAQKILNALDQDEAELRKAIKFKEEKSDPKKIDKNW